MYIYAPMCMYIHTYTFPHWNVNSMRAEIVTILTFVSLIPMWLAHNEHLVII